MRVLRLRGGPQAVVITTSFTTCILKSGEMQRTTRSSPPGGGWTRGFVNFRPGRRAGLLYYTHLQTCTQSSGEPLLSGLHQLRSPGLLSAAPSSGGLKSLCNVQVHCQPGAPRSEHAARAARRRLYTRCDSVVPRRAPHFSNSPLSTVAVVLVLQSIPVLNYVGPRTGILRY